VIVIFEPGSLVVTVVICPDRANVVVLIWVIVFDTVVLAVRLLLVSIYIE
jgi:hypothetical protein